MADVRERNVRFVRPSAELEAEFLDMARDFEAASIDMYRPALEDFRGYLRGVLQQGLCRKWRLAWNAFADCIRNLLGERRRVEQLIAEGGKSPKKGTVLRKGYVCQTTFWLQHDDGRLLGTCIVRHRLTPFLLYEGGHLGVDLRPSARAMGYGIHLAELCVEKARELGFKRVLSTVDEDNRRSRRIIEKTGGKLENSVISHSGKVKLRYWTDLTRTEQPT